MSEVEKGGTAKIIFLRLSANKKRENVVEKKYFACELCNFFSPLKAMQTRCTLNFKSELLCVVILINYFYMPLPSWKI
jgi:hypothetical protein